MDWADEPATETQVIHLKRLGYTPNHPLTRGEAVQIIRSFEPKSSEPPIRESTEHEPYYLRKLVESAKKGATGASASGTASPDLASLVSKRQEFWLDTCRDIAQMHLKWSTVIDLYQKQGCRFFTPTYEQTQTILDALDAAMPYWDRDHPELFYQTLELNFPQLVKRG